MRAFRNWDKYWANRKIDWDTRYLQTWNHPHRRIIIEALHSFSWGSLWEIGCASGPNLVKISKEFEHVDLGGSDLSADAVALAQKSFKGALFEVRPAHNTLLSDKSCDVILTDMTLIYVGRLKIKKVLREIKRIGRVRLVMVEFDSTKWYRRLWLRLTEGYNAYDYKKLLEKEGYYDIIKLKIPEQYYPEHSKTHKEFAHIIVATI
jgi:ubiquinone/menaquinone biosynthesis C-methylase UbiE